MFEESVKICNEGLKKVCDNTTVGAGEEVLCTFFFTLQQTLQQWYSDLVQIDINEAFKKLVNWYALEGLLLNDVT